MRAMFQVKTAAPHILPIILHVVNLSIAKFPDTWKIQLIRPHYKREDKLDGCNYRPVSNIPELSKVVEFDLFDQLMEHFVENELFHPNHHGFRAGHSTCTAMIQMYDSWVQAVDKGELAGVCMLDMSTAFDVVDHTILPEKFKLVWF